MASVVFCGGNALPDDVHLAADVVAVDGEIVRVIERLASCWVRP